MKNAVKIQVGDAVVIKNGGAKARGLVIVAPNEFGSFRIRSASGREYPATVSRVLEHTPVAPVVPVVPVVADPVEKPKSKRGGVRQESMLGRALAILLTDGQPRHVKDLTEAVLASGFETTGKTPQATLAAHLLVAERKGLVEKTAPATFRAVTPSQPTVVA